MAIRVLIHEVEDDTPIVDWVVRNCDGFLYSITFENDDLELFFATEQDVVLFKLRYF